MQTPNAGRSAQTRVKDRISTPFGKLVGPRSSAPAPPCHLRQPGDSRRSRSTLLIEHLFNIRNARDASQLENPAATQRHLTIRHRVGGSGRRRSASAWNLGPGRPDAPAQVHRDAGSPDATHDGRIATRNRSSNPDLGGRWRDDPADTSGFADADWTVADTVGLAPAMSPARAGLEGQPRVRIRPAISSPARSAPSMKPGKAGASSVPVKQSPSWASRRGACGSTLSQGLAQVAYPPPTQG